MDATSLLDKHKVVPVVVINDAAKALKLAEVFLNAQLSCIEVTLRTKNALACIEAIAREFPEATVGAGSIVTPNQLSAAENAGSSFAVSPGSSDELLNSAESSYLIPGVATASEIMKLKSLDYRTVKFFPAELLGGLKMISALSEPIKDIQFFPTGGIRETNFQDYLASDRVTCVGGSWLASASEVENGHWDVIKERCATVQRLLRN